MDAGAEICCCMSECPGGKGRRHDTGAMCNQPVINFFGILSPSSLVTWLLVLGGL